MQYNHPIPVTYTFPRGITSFSRFRSSLGLAVALPLFRVASLHCPCSLYGWDDAARLVVIGAATL
jgi:hypothetical protein